jgi:nucleotide-binding universal stress UspA family protein
MTDTSPSPAIPPPSGTPLRVLVAVDETATSIHAARVAGGLFAHDHAEFLVLNVGQVVVPWVPDGVTWGAVATVPSSGWQTFTTGLDEHSVHDQAEAAGLGDATVLTDQGDPVERILAIAEEQDVDVIVVGTHQKSWWGRLLDRSISDGVLHGTDRPVLVIPDVSQD